MGFILLTMFLTTTLYLYNWGERSLWSLVKTAIYSTVVTGISLVLFNILTLISIEIGLTIGNLGFGYWFLEGAATINNFIFNLPVFWFLALLLGIMTVPQLIKHQLGKSRHWFADSLSIFSGSNIALLFWTLWVTTTLSIGTVSLGIGASLGTLYLFYSQRKVTLENNRQEATYPLLVGGNPNENRDVYIDLNSMPDISRLKLKRKQISEMSDEELQAHQEELIRRQRLT